MSFDFCCTCVSFSPFFSFMIFSEMLFSYLFRLMYVFVIHNFVERFQFCCIFLGITFSDVFRVIFVSSYIFFHCIFLVITFSDAFRVIYVFVFIYIFAEFCQFCYISFLWLHSPLYFRVIIFYVNFRYFMIVIQLSFLSCWSMFSDSSLGFVTVCLCSNSPLNFNTCDHIHTHFEFLSFSAFWCLCVHKFHKLFIDIYSWILFAKIDWMC